jgi:hypothetical protein
MSSVINLAPAMGYKDNVNTGLTNPASAPTQSNAGSAISTRAHATAA